MITNFPGFFPGSTRREQLALEIYAHEVGATEAEVVRQVVVERLEEEGYLPRNRGIKTLPTAAGGSRQDAAADETAIMGILDVVGLDGGTAMLAQFAETAEDGRRSEASGNSGGIDHGT